MFGFGWIEIGIVILVTFSVAWISSLLDILKSDFTGNNKIVWLLAVIFLPPIGVIAYRFAGTKQKVTDKQSSSQGKKCPYCAELIKAEAVVCHFCNRDLPVNIEAR